MNVPFDRTAVRKILLIKLRAVGDVLLSTIVTKNVRAAFPAARIDFLTEPPALDILRGNPNIDGALVYDLKVKSPLAYIMDVRASSYDLVIDLFGNPRTALLTRLSGSRYRVGFDFRGRSYAYNIVVQPRGDRVHNSQFNLDAIEKLGIPIIDRSLQFPLTAADEDYVDRFLPRAEFAGTLLVGLITAGGWYTKRWGLERFAELADRLAVSHGARVVLPWGPGQKEEVEKVQAFAKKPILVPPPTNLRQLGALLKRCSFVVSNDSGPMHIAAAVGTPVLGIYGPTNPDLQGPYGDSHIIVREGGLDCLGCNLTTCPIGHPCMVNLAVESVMNGVERLMTKNRITTNPR
jgi:heptosyltransferase III